MMELDITDPYLGLGREEYYRKRKETMLEMQQEARKILDKFSHEEFMAAIDGDDAPNELIQCIRDINNSIIEDWIQDYYNEREMIHEMKMVNLESSNS